MIKQPIITFKQFERDRFPHYYDYSIAIEKVVNILHANTGQTYDIYSFEDDLDMTENVIQQLIEYKSPEMEYIAPIFEHLSYKKVHLQDEAFHSLASADNNLFYFPDFDVAYANIHIFQNHIDYPHEMIFAASDAEAEGFFQFIEEKSRELMLEGITVLTDTEDGLENDKESITAQISREDVLLEERMKRDIFRAIDEFFTNGGAFFKTYDIPYRRGILLYGSPGNGKTTLVKSIAGSVHAPVIYWQITEYTNSYSISEVFEMANKMAPVILIIEDIDSMPTESRSVFLNALDGATTKEGIFLIGTTNYPERIDPALINRAGRFDRAYEIKQPSTAMRKTYLQHKNISQFVEDVSLDAIAKQTKGLSIAQLNELYMSMALEWHYEQTVDVEKIIQALKENHRRAMKQEWDTDDDEGGIGF